MKKGIKPFTLFLFLFVVIYLVIGTKIFLVNTNKDEQRYNEEEFFSEWTGVITLWDIPYIETGTVSNSSWLNARIEKFERENPGVFIDVKRLTPQRAQMYFLGNIDKDILPDIISIPLYEDFVPSYLYEDLRPYFQDEELNRIAPLALKPAMRDKIMQGVPVMMGTYALFFNYDMLQEQGMTIEDNEIDLTTLDRIVRNLSYVKEENRKEVHYYGFGSYNSTYSKPIASMIYNQSGKIQDDYGYKYIYSWTNGENLVPEDIGSIDSSRAMSMFVDEARIEVFLGNTKVLYKIKESQKQGKGFETGISCLPMEGKDGLFQDQIAIYGLIKKDHEIKRHYSIAFLKSLLSEEAQRELKKIGMFSIIGGIDYIYEDDPEMHILERNLTRFKYSPADEDWQVYKNEIMDIFKAKADSSSDILE